MGILCAASGCASSHKVPGARTDMEHEIEGLQKQAGTQAQGDPVYKVTPGVFITDGRRLPVPRNANLPELFNKTFALRGRIHSVKEVASLVSAQVALPVNIAQELLTQNA